MVSSITPNSKEQKTLPAGIGRHCSALSDVFETPFLPWEFIESWQPASTEVSHLPFPEVIRESLQQVEFNAGPSIAMLESDRVMLIVPLKATQKSRYSAIASFSGHNVKLLKKLAEKTLKEISQQEEINSLNEQAESSMQQISLDFEEQAWMRDLVEHLEYCDVTNSLESVAEKILTPLCKVIKAEALVLIPRENNAASNKSLQIGSLSFQTGKNTFDDHLCRQLVQCFYESAQEQTVVQNQLDQFPEISNTGDLRSCVLMQLGKNNEQFGWLLAINRIEFSDHEVWGDHCHPNDISEQEFGTIEANLLGAAAMMLSTHARNLESFRSKELLLIGVIRSMINALDAKDAYTCGHSDRVALMSKRLAEQIGLDKNECEQIYMTGLLHDIGKIGVSDAVLGKPGRLTDEEFEEIKKHPVIGHKILSHLDQISYVLPGVLYHHEQVDGSGYPHGLKHDEIPLPGRILAVADAYDAMTSDRPYRKGMPYEKAENIITSGAGTQWDAMIVEAFFVALNDIHTICEDSQDHTQALLMRASCDATQASVADSIINAVETILPGESSKKEVLS